MTERLGDLWGAWERDLPSTQLTLLLVLAGIAWIGASVLTAHSAARHHRGTYTWGFAVTAAGVGVLALSPIAPRDLPWVVIAAVVAVVAMTGIAHLRIRSTAVVCELGHGLADTWIYCPACTSPAPAKAFTIAGVPVHRPQAKAYQPGQVPDGSGTIMSARGQQAARAPEAPPAGLHGGPPPALIRLVPDRPDLAEVAVPQGGALIGRDPGADISLPDPSASWEHARIVERNGGATIIDLNSSNGTFVNGQRVETSPLLVGDRIQIGDTELRVER